MTISLNSALNAILEEEKAGYRVVDYSITPITDENEIRTVESAIGDSRLPVGVSEHLRTALEMVSDRKAPDYRNSIKESISAVEGTCQYLTGAKGNELGKTLSILESEFGLHKALKSGFSAIYGYTSGADGIRHAMLEASSVNFEDAYFFLVICSAFINFLLQKIAKK